ncbi:shugoshin-1-like isoform X1 [Panicum miliaceum]|uniref:Shugoshin-1-like isoform X1 n=1 Tax=Panicum miliaceum TaxID=4540 RepID=A0A3L6Q5A4_PANMI|nr:shugoshin-1-like isoform X1 [Panicum miliaceum]
MDFEFRSAGAGLTPLRPDSPAPPSSPAAQSAPSPPEFASRALKSNSFPCPDRAAAASTPHTATPLDAPRAEPPAPSPLGRYLGPAPAAGTRSPALLTPGAAVAASLHGRRRLHHRGSAHYPGGAAVGGSNPSLGPPPGKGNKPTALADITNTGKPNASRSISGADVVKLLAWSQENAMLSHLLREKIKIIELSKVEMHKLHLALQASRQQNLQLAQANSQMLAELNTGKDRIKALQHELSCTAALLKVKASEIERKNKTANQRRKEENSQDVLKAIPSKVTAAEAHRIDGSIISAVVESQSAVPSNTGCQEPPQQATKKRKTQRRRSSRLNQGSCEINEVSDKTLLENAAVSSAPSTLSVEKQHGPTIGKDMWKSLQNECNAVVYEVMASEFEEIEIDEQPPKEANLKEIQEACSSVAAVESHQIGDKAHNAKQSHLAESQAFVQSNIIEPHKPPEDTIIRRKSQRRKSSRLNPAPSEDMKSTFETLQEDVITPLAPSSSNVSMEQRADLKQNEACSAMKSTEGRVQGRRSMRRAAEKVISYKEIPLNIKMRRP